MHSINTPLNFLTVNYTFFFTGIFTTYATKDYLFVGEYYFPYDQLYLISTSNVNILNKISYLSNQYEYLPYYDFDENYVCVILDKWNLKWELRIYNTNFTEINRVIIPS